MGQSTDGMLVFGVVCEEDAEMPWDADPYYGDIEDWWRDVNGYVPLFQPFTEDGEYAEGFSFNDPRMEAYRKHRRDWMDANPCPVEVENACSDRCPLYVLSVPGVGKRCSRGYPEEIDPESLKVTPGQILAVLEFAQRFDLSTDNNPRWLLCSYWEA